MGYANTLLPRHITSFMLWLSLHFDKFVSRASSFKIKSSFPHTNVTANQSIFEKSSAFTAKLGINIIFFSAVFAYYYYLSFIFGVHIPSSVVKFLLNWSLITLDYRKNNKGYPVTFPTISLLYFTTLLIYKQLIFFQEGRLSYLLLLTPRQNEAISFIKS